MRGSIVGGPVEAGASPVVLRGSLRGTTVRGRIPDAQEVSASIASRPLAGSFRIGPPGPAGGGGGSSYTHTQSVAATDWTVNHNLGYYPKAVQVVDSGGNVWIGEIQHTNTNSLVIRFGFPFTGTATVG